MNQNGPMPIATPADPVWTAAAARQIDQLSIENFNIPQSKLMDAAGKAVAAAAQKLGRTFLVLAGPGNNGGDALVAARELSQDPANQVHVVRVPNSSKEFSFQLPADFDCVIDGILGLGFKGKLDPHGPAGRVLAEVRRIVTSRNHPLRAKSIQVVAVDLPSGLDCDNAGAHGAPLPADVCVTFGGVKSIHAVAPARDLCGQVTCAQIGFAEEAIKQALAAHPPVHAVVRAPELLGLNPWQQLPPGAHKYDRGHVLVIGGSTGKTGAPVLSAMAALRAGAGWATVSIPETKGHPTFLPPDLTSEPLWASGKNCAKIDYRKLEKFLATRNVKAVVVGPGTMVSPLDSKSMGILREFSRTGFVVIDAGGLHSIIELLVKQRSAKPPAGDNSRILLTPHPGEWRRLINPAATTIWPAPLDPAATIELQKRCTGLGIHLLYKHATPVLSGPSPFAIDAAGNELLSSSTLVFNRGSNALGRAGTGDVLAGAIAAHGAIGCPVDFATMRALALVAGAAELAAARVGYHAVLPTDIIQDLGRAG